jgi:hypothetical protein
MRRFTGYISDIQNPNFSGIATVVVRSKRYPTKRRVPSTDPQHVRLGFTLMNVGKLNTFLTESGYGVRQLANIFDGFSNAGQHTKARFTVDEMGMLVNVEVLEDN